jgi:hypothetical protein
MKVYTCPDECQAPTVDYRNYDGDKERAREAQHQVDLKAFLISAGYTGKHTGKIFRAGVADGYAEYMMADGRGSCLIHLPYGDGYQYRDVQFLPKKEVLARIAIDAKLASIFSR